jgi:hypothetical protein
MNGALYYVAGEGFDARQDIWDLQARIAEEDRYAGFASAIRLLIDLATDGFKPDRDGGLLEPTDADNVLLFEDAGMRLALEVPGQGRAATPDISLLAAQFCGLDRKSRKAGRAAFVATALERRKTGQRMTWPLAKSR